MRHLWLPMAMAIIASPVLSTRAQGTCAPDALPAAARAVAAVRHTLHGQAVEENDPAVPPAIATQLVTLKTALAQVADAVLACAPPNASPDDLQATLAEAIHANTASATSSVFTRGKQDVGAYGSDLDVQVLPLFGSPRFLEVNFRYGLECGDDNLLMVFQSTNGAPWHELLRWGAPRYSTVADALGDFVLLTPLSGFPGERNWRFVVAHGQPACAAAPNAASHLDIDLLQPTADPARPDVVWHLEKPYPRGAVPRLVTTEDTLTLDVRPVAEKGAHPPPAADTYRFRISKDNQVQALTDAAGQ